MHEAGEALDFSSQVLEAVTAYAIDVPSRTEDEKTVLGALGLDPGEFFTHMYVRRPGIKQAELAGYVQAGSLVILVYGFPGVGKTSFVESVLYDLREQLTVIRVDFKSLEALAGELLEVDVKSELDVLLMNRCKELLMSWDKNESDVVCELIRNPRRQAKSEQFVSAEYQFFSEYKDELKARHTMATSAGEWVDELLKKGDAPVAKTLKHLGQRLQLVDLMYAMKMLDPRGRTCVVFFDNVDSIHSDETRDQFFTYVRRLHATIAGLARLVVAGRTCNLVLEVLSDSGTYLINDIPVDYSEFIDANELEKQCEKCRERQGFCSTVDKMRIEERLESSARELFAHEILEKRNDYLDRRLREGLEIPLKKENLARMRSIHGLAMRDTRIFGTALELANLDRREMLVHISNFTRFATEELGTTAEKLALTEEERLFILESYFYHWINDRGAILGTGVYDLVRDWSTWWNGGKQGLGCSLTHLVIGAIYNLTGRVRGKHAFLPRTTIAQVVDRLEELGYREDAILPRILEMYKQGDTFIGLLETERFYKVRTIHDLKHADAIWLTPRAAHLCEYLSLKLLFVLSQMRKNRYMYKSKAFNFKDSDPVTVRSLAALLSFLCRLAEMHLKGLASIKNELRSKSDSWLLHFRSRFCIRVRDRADVENAGDLLLENMLDSHIKFLRHQGGIAPWEFIEEMKIVEWFERLLQTFRDDVDLLVRGSLDLSSVEASNYERRVGLPELEKLAERRS